MNWYTKWCTRVCSKTQCSPSLWIFGGLVIFGVTVYHYRAMLASLLVIMALCLAVSVAIAISLGVIVNSVRWHRRRAVSEAAPDTIDTDSVPKAITGDAEMLSDDSVVLRWTPDGKSLEAVKE